MPQIRDYTSASTGTTATSSVPTPAYQAGDILIALHSCDSGSTGQMTISGTGWSDAVVPVSGSNFFTRAWVKTAGGSEPASFSFGQASGADAVIAIVSVATGQFSSADSASVIDNDGGATVVNAGSAGSAGDVILIWTAAAGGNVPSRTWNEPAGWTPMVDRQSGTYTTACLVSRTFTADGNTGSATFTASAPVTQAHTIKLRMRTPVTLVDKSGSDSAAVTEQPSSIALPPMVRSDSAAVAELAARLVGDQGAVTETPTLSGAPDRGDTATVSETADTSAAQALAETGMASETSQLTIVVSRDDAVGLTETVEIMLAVGDQGLVTESATAEESLGPSTRDLVAVSEVATASAQVDAGDTVVLADVARVDVLRSATDAAAVVEQTDVGSTVTEGAVVIESAHVSVVLDRHDGAIVVDLGTAADPISATDSAALAETALVTDPGRKITGVDGPRRQWSASVAPRRWNAEPPRRTWSATHT
ncbi:hypothetical protein AB0392_34875 [Nonomuraea angiospora]|uniref:hypothetical protein n=1 Tax=Nonomuraea angiospora TaxID=46172 RepID=UPI00344C1407